MKVIVSEHVGLKITLPSWYWQLLTVTYQIAVKTVIRRDLVSRVKTIN